MRRLHNTNNSNIIISERKYPQEGFPVFKPHGLWYGIDNSWFDWVKPNMPEKVGKHTFKLDIDTNSLLVIKTLSELNNFINQYEIFTEPFTGIDWAKVSKDFSGIEIVNYDELKWNYHNFKHVWVLAWDVDSGCIWDLSVIKNIKQIK